MITSSTEDLRAAGYHAADVEPEVTLVPAYVTLDNDNEMCARLEIYCSPHEQLKIFLQVRASRLVGLQLVFNHLHEQ